MIESIDKLLSITVLARWFGFAVPPHQSNRLDISKRNSFSFEAFDGMSQSSHMIPSKLVEDFLRSIADLSESPDPKRFGQSREALDWHFGGCHTDDYPAMRIRLEFENQFFVELMTSSNHAHLLPWEIKTEDERTSFNPQMSICLAKLLPDDFLFRNRLLESSGIFRSDALIREERERWELERANEQSKKSIEQTSATKSSEGLPNQGTKPQYSAKKLRRLSEEELKELVATGYESNRLRSISRKRPQK